MDDTDSWGAPVAQLQVKSNVSVAREQAEQDLKA